MQALDALSPKDRELLMLVAWEGLSPAEIAVTLGVSSNVVRKRLFRARKRLSDAVQQIEGEQASNSGHSSTKDQKPGRPEQVVEQQPELGPYPITEEVKDSG